jgi:3-hydroxybutyryl-CoA dehydrogenase
MTAIEHVAVAGAGAMGSQIGMVCALAGLQTKVYDVNDAATDKATTSLQAWLSRAVDKGRLSPADRDAAWARLSFHGDLPSAAADADLVIEAVVEKIDVKRALLAELGRLTSPRAILTSNTSSFVPSRMADATGRPEQFANLHFFNPALVMACVEVVRGPQTSDATVQTLLEFTKRIGKTPVLLEKEIPGFIANRILNAVRDEAIYLLENGYASVTSIDTACRTALGYPMGPFELMDLTGIDIGYYTKVGRYAETGDPADAPSATVTALVERGDLGRKTGRGFYTYDSNGTKIEEAK